MKRFLSMFMSIVMLLSITAGLDLTAYAQVLTGSCGENVTYTLDTDSGVLTISGTGEMKNYSSSTDDPSSTYAPWYTNRSFVKTVEIEYGVTSIGREAFYSCDSLTSVTIGNSVTSIGDGAFSNCVSLTSVTIPNSVTSIGDWAFCGCNSLTSIEIPNSVTSIGDGAFSDCDSLTRIDVDDSNQNYSSQDGVLFNKDKTVLIQYLIGNTRTSYTIPNSVTKIGNAAFDSCYSLTSVTIGNSVTSIDDYAFAYCSRLTSVTIPNSVTSIGDYAFCDCYSLISITIPNSVTSIGDHAFDSCNSLTSITIPNSVTSIGYSAFDDCDSLTSITVDGNNQNYSSQDGVFFNKDKTVLIQYPIGNTRTSYIIPNSVTSIGDDAFEHCDSLTSITIPNSVTSIDDYAFGGCDSLTSVTIGNSVTSIGDSAFESCDSLSDVYYSGSDNEWNNISIGDYNDSLNNATIHYNSTGPENSGGSTGGGSTGGGGGGFVPATPEEPATIEPTTQPTAKPTVPTTTTTTVKKPSTVKVEKVTKGTKSFKVTWKKNTGVSGYQVQYATDKKFKKNKKTVTIAKKNAKSKTIKKLKSKKTYYVRVRTYKIVNGKKVYSSWSKVKAVKTK